MVWYSRHVFSILPIYLRVGPGYWIFYPQYYFLRRIVTETVILVSLLVKQCANMKEVFSWNQSTPQLESFLNDGWHLKMLVVIFNN